MSNSDYVSGALDKKYEIIKVLDEMAEKYPVGHMTRVTILQIIEKIIEAA